MYELNSKLKKLKPYDPIEGNYNIRLDANESCFNINEKLGEKISEEISRLSLNRYPDPMASEAVKAFAEYYNVPEAYVTAGNGSDELISVITSCFLEKSDKILTMSPDFSMYAFYGNLYELNVETMLKNDLLQIDIEKVIEYCNVNSIKAVIFSNPCNPTSLGISRQEVIKLLENTSCLVIVDEAYMDFWDQSILDQAEEYDNLIVLKTCSKSIGLAGIRMGFAVAGDMITSALRSAKSPYNTDAVSQTICKTVFEEKKLLQKWCTELVESRKMLHSELLALAQKYVTLGKIYDSVTNFVFIKTAYGKCIYEKLLEKSIAIRFMGNYIRITAGTKKENETVIKAIDEILSSMEKGE